MNFYNFKPIRKLLSNKTFVCVNDNWIDINSYNEGKVTDVDGNWHTQFYCKCGNELVHSMSFLQERDLGRFCVFDYKCSNCKKEVYANPDIAPCLISCDKNGNPLP